MNDVLTAPVLSPIAPPTVPSVPLAETSRIEYANERPVFSGLVLRGAWLELVTFGFYRFWLATDMRRHLWSHTSVEGDAPEYTGTPKELLIGFLFALAILVPLYLGYFLMGIEAERLQAFASTPLAVFYYLFVQFAVYRARRYRLTRTVWRGVRFSMGGSGMSYAWRVGLWTMLTFISLGFALPWRQAALERFKMRHTAYGNLQGSFVGTGGALLRRGWGLWALPIGVIVVVAVLADQVPALSVILTLIALVAAPFWYAAYKAIEWRWWIGGLRFGEVRFESDFKSDRLSGLYWMMIVWTIVIGIGFGIWMGAVSGISYGLTGVAISTDATMLEMLQSPVWLIGAAIGYMGYILAIWAAMRIYLIHDVWQRVASSITVHNLAAARDVVEQGQTVNAIGEGLADSLDIGGL